MTAMTEKATTQEGKTGAEMIQQFESGAIPATGFHHADHVRLAFEYLSTYPVLKALESFSSALQRFASAHGKPNLYHETITWAYLFLVHERIVRAQVPLTWEEFAGGNRDLFVGRGGVLTTMYRPETLESDLARKIFILPDQISPTSCHTL